MIVCSNCGTAMEDDLRFCTECGTPNPATRTGDATVSLGAVPTLQVSASDAIKFQNPPTPQITTPFNQVRPGGVMPPGNSSIATTSNRTPLIIVGVVAGLLLLILGGVGSRLLLSDNRSAERAPDNAQTGTARNEPVTTPVRTSTPLQMQTQLPSQTPPRNTAPMFDEPALRREVIDTLNAWEEAVRQHDLDRHMTYYSDTLDVYYKRSNVSKAYVRSTLTPAYDRYSTLDVQLSNISVAIDQSGAVASVTFDKTYRFEGDKVLSGSVQQALSLTKTNGRWLIASVRDLRVYYSNK